MYQYTEGVVVIAGSIAPCSDRRWLALVGRLLAVEVAAGNWLNFVPFSDGS